jgi:mannose-6-phosphate isomerase-like protein (cupin superfamily)
MALRARLPISRREESDHAYAYRHTPNLCGIAHGIGDRSGAGAVAARHGQSRLPRGHPERSGKTPPHRHARSAFVTAYVLSGEIRSQVDDGKVQVFKAGESFSEPPGALHRISENASTTEPAKLLAIFVVDSNDTELTTIEGK